MSMIQRYVASIKNYLPNHLREDVGQEIQALLEDKVEELEEQTGKPADEAALSQILKDLGHPMKVASAYGEQQALIGRELFPFYKQTLKYLAIGLLIFYIATTLTGLLIQHDGGFFSRLDLGGFGDYFDTYLYLAAWATFIFYCVERWSEKKDYYGNWNPLSLPPVVRDNQSIPLFSTTVNIIFTLIFCAFVNGFLPIPLLSDNQGLDVVFTQEAVALTPVLNILIVIFLVLGCINLVKPYWTKWKLLAHILSDALFSGVLIMLLEMRPLFIVTPQNTELAAHLRRSVGITLAIILAFVVWDILKNLRLFLRFNKPES